MNRKKIGKGLKFLSIAGAMLVLSSTALTAEEASASIFSRFTRGVRGIFTGRGISGFRSARNTATTTTTSRSSQLQARLDTRPLPPLPPRSSGNGPLPQLPSSRDLGPSSGATQLKVKFRGIGKDRDPRSVSGIVDFGNRSTSYFGKQDPRGVVRLAGKGSGRTPLQTVDFTNQGVVYAELNLTTGSGSRKPVGGASGGNETIYTKVKGSANGGSGVPEGLYARVKKSETGGSGGIVTQFKVRDPREKRNVTVLDPGNGWSANIQDSGDPRVGDLVVFKRTK